MKKYKGKIILLFIGAMMLLSHNVTFAQKYNESDKEVLRKFGRKPSAVLGELNINQMWKTQVPFDTSNWYADESWITNLSGVLWDDERPKHVLEIHWQRSKLADSIDLTGCDSLQLFNCQENEVTGVNVRNNLKLRIIYVGINELKYLDVTNNTRLKTLDFCHNQITSVDVHNNPKVTWLCARYNQLTKMDLTGLDLIQSIWLDNNKLRFSSFLQKKEYYLYYNMFPQDTTDLDGACRKDVDLSSEYVFKDSIDRPVKTNFSWFRLEGSTEIPVPAQHVIDNNGVFTFNPVVSEHYRCKMTNKAFSNRETLVSDFYLFDGAVTQQPQSHMLCPHTKATLSINSSFPNIKYQWQMLNKDSVWQNISGATDSTWIVSEEGEYRVMLQGVYCNLSSDTALITVSKSSFIAGKTSDCNYDPSKVLSVNAAYVDAYVWKLNGVDLHWDSASCPILDTGTYVAKVTDICGMPDSATIHVGINPMRIYVDSVLQGDSFTTTTACDKDFVTVDVSCDTLYHKSIFIDGHPYSSYDYSIPKDGRNDVVVKTIDVKGKEMEYSLTVNRPFANIFHIRWDDVLVVPLKVDGIDGLEKCTKVEWFKMKDDNSYEKINRDPSKGYLQIKENGTYFVVVNDVFQFCPINFVLPAGISKVSPNPSRSNAEVTLITGLKEEELKNAKILLMNAEGKIVSDFDLNTPSLQMRTPVAPGVYTIIIESPDSNRKTLKMVVVN